MKKSENTIDDTERFSSLLNSFRSRVLVLSNAPVINNSDNDKRIVKPTIPPVPAPGDNKDEIFIYENLLKGVISNAPKIKMEDFNPFIEMLGKEELVVRIIDASSRKENQIIDVKTNFRIRPNVSRFIKIDVDKTLLREGNTYVIIVRDKGGNLLHITFRIG